MIDLDNLTDDLRKQPYGLNIQLLRLNEQNYVIKLINFASVQISNKKALGFSIDLHVKINDHDIEFNDDGNLLKLATEAIKIIYNLQLKQTKVRKINVVPIYTNGLVRYMNSPNSMFSYLKPVNQNGKIVQHFHTHGYSNLKKAIAEYAVMALSIIHYAEINLKQRQSNWQ